MRPRSRPGTSGQQTCSHERGALSRCCRSRLGPRGSSSLGPEHQQYSVGARLRIGAPCCLWPSFRFAMFTRGARRAKEQPPQGSVLCSLRARRPQRLYHGRGGRVNSYDCHRAASSAPRNFCASSHQNRPQSVVDAVAGRPPDESDQALSPSSAALLHAGRERLGALPPCVGRRWKPQPGPRLHGRRSLRSQG
jgi:hypothetical protein